MFVTQNAKFPQFSGTNSVVQTNALLLLHGALATNTLYISWALHHQQIYVVPPGRFLCLAIAFEQALFPGLTVCRLTIFFSLCVDLKAGMSRDQFEPFRSNLVDLVHEWTITRIGWFEWTSLVETSHANCNWTSNDLSYFTLTSFGRNVKCIFRLDRFL